MNTKGFISNLLNYSGQVNINLVRNGKVFTVPFLNKGTKLLTNAIAKALAGQDISDTLPRYLDFTYVIEQDGEDTQEGRLINTKIPFVGIVWGDVALPANIQDPEGSALLLQATISSADKVIVTNLDSIKDFRLCITTKTGEVLAFVSDPTLKDMYNALSEGTDAIIEWRMLFHNNIKE